MRRSWQRLIAVLFAPWFAVVAADIPGLHVCPVHDSTVSALAAPASHAAGAMAMHSHSIPGSQHESHHGCTCVGGCCAASGSALPATPITTTAAIVGRRYEAPRSHRSVIVERVEHTLPFATAPPNAIA